jgi:hypothetical protein
MILGQNSRLNYTKVLTRPVIYGPCTHSSKFKGLFCVIIHSPHIAHVVVTFSSLPQSVTATVTCLCGLQVPGGLTCIRLSVLNNAQYFYCHLCGTWFKCAKLSLDGNANVFRRNKAKLWRVLTGNSCIESYH